MIKQFLDDGYDFNILYILKNINNLDDHIRIRGWKELCKMKGLINDESLTEKGLEIILQFSDEGQKKHIEEEKQRVGDFSQFCKELHEKLVNKIKNLYFIKQYYIRVEGKKYPYLCGAIDLEDRLKSAIKKYNLTDLKKIENLLLIHVENPNQKIQNYIIKKGSDSKSDLASDYENYEEEVINLDEIDTRNLY